MNPAKTNSEKSRLSEEKRLDLALQLQQRFGHVLEGHAVGGFDEDYFMYVEDADLTQKMRTRGKVYLVPQYTAIHAWHRAAHRSLKPFLWQLRSLLRYFSKWGFAW